MPKKSELDLSPDACILWDGRISKMRGIYVGIISKKDKNFLVHRLVVQEQLGRPLNTKEEIARLCGESLCINPDHLVATNRMMRMQINKAKGVKVGPKKKDFCVNGHSLNNKRNVRKYRRQDSPWVTRVCKACDRISSREYNRRKRAKQKSKQLDSLTGRFKEDGQV